MPQHTSQQTAQPAALKLGAGCTIAGALAIASFRLAHGDLPAADAPAALAFITRHPFYAGIHIGTILGVLAWAGGIVAFSAPLRSGLAARTAFTILRGTSLTSILILWGVPLLLLGRAMLLDGYARWLGWTGLTVGAVIILAALALLLREELFPGVLLYGLLASIVVPLWSLALGVAMWRRAGTAHG